MESFNVEWKHGHFVVKGTNKRLIPRQGYEYIVVAPTGGFQENDEQSEHLGVVKDAQAKELWALAKYGKGNFRKLLSANTPLYFRVGNSHVIKGDTGREYLFKALPLEDVYMYLIKGRSPGSALSWRLAPCICKLANCVIGDVSLPEPVPVSASLGRLFNDTVAHYFSRQRSGSANPFNTFFIMQENERLSMACTKKDYVGMLSNLRRVKAE